jgi:hypothetical protein
VGVKCWGAPQRFACVSVINYDVAAIRSGSSVMRHSDFTVGQWRLVQNRKYLREKFLSLTLNQLQISIYLFWVIKVKTNEQLDELSKQKYIIN